MKPISTLVAHFGLSVSMSPKSDEELKYMSKVPHSSAFRRIMFAMVCTPSDIGHVVSVFTRYITSPGKCHWQAVKWMLRYLKGTSDLYLVFGRNSTGLFGYVVSNYAGDLDRRRSLTGCVFTIGSCAMCWKATL